MRRIRPLRVLLVLAIASCGWLGDDEEEEKKEAATAPRLIGRVASVNEQRKFVLIEGYGEWQLGEGLILSSLGDERTASLLASGERMGRYSAADIQSGQVAVGDVVYGRPLVAEPAAVDADPAAAEPARATGAGTDHASD